MIVGLLKELLVEKLFKVMQNSKMFENQNHSMRITQPQI